MSDISKIDIAGTELDIKDATARELLNTLSGTDDLSTATVGSAAQAVYLDGGVLVAGYLIQGGISSSISTDSGTYTDGTITFETPYSTVPYVQATCRSASYAIEDYYIRTTSLTTSSFGYRILNGSAASRSCNIWWLAIGPVS